MGLKSGYLKAGSFWRLQGTIHSLPLPASRGYLHSWLLTRSSQYSKPLHPSSHLLFLTCLSHKNSCDYLGLTKIIQDNLTSHDPQSHLQSLFTITQSQFWGLRCGNLQWDGGVHCFAYHRHHDVECKYIYRTVENNYRFLRGLMTWLDFHVRR